MIEEPTRLIHDDPEFASLAAASNNDGPSSAEVDKALALATRTAMTSPRTSWRWFGASLAVGIAVIGTSVIGLVGMPGAAPARDAAVRTSVVTAPAPNTPAAETLVETPVMTVSVDDLASAPSAPPAADLSARTSQARAAAPAVVARSGSPEAQNESAKTSLDSRSDTELGRTDAGSSTFAEEFALVSAARSALGRGDVPACMRAVDRYGERFRSGMFAQEIEVIRIEALAASGERARAHADAERFLAANARSPYADRVRSLLERTSR